MVNTVLTLIVLVEVSSRFPESGFLKFFLNWNVFSVSKTCNYWKEQKTQNLALILRGKKKKGKKAII